MSSDSTASNEESSEDQSEGVAIGEIVTSLAKLKGAEEELDHIEQAGEDITEHIAFLRMVDKADLETAGVLSKEMALILDEAAAEHEAVTVGSIAFAHWLALEKLLLSDEDGTGCADDDSETETSGGGEPEATGGEDETSPASEEQGIIMESDDDRAGTEVDPAFY